MNNELLHQLIDEVIDDVPASAALRMGKGNPYGCVPGLDDEDLADPEELERLAFLRDFEPILSLPVRRRDRWVRPTIDENGHRDWGAFGSVDFARMVPEFDKVRYRAEKVREELADLLITIGIVKERLPSPAAEMVLVQVQLGVIEISADHIPEEDMRLLAQLVRRADRLKKQLQDLQKRRGNAPARGEARPGGQMPGRNVRQMRCAICGNVRQVDRAGPLCLKCDKQVLDARNDAWQESWDSADPGQRIV